MKSDLSMTLKPEYFGKPEKGCGRDIGAKIIFKEQKITFIVYFPNFLHIIISQNYDLKFHIKFSSHGHSKTYWVFVPSFLYMQVCVYANTHAHGCF